ncbi:TonB-dependent receptor [soil metagenome]
MKKTVLYLLMIIAASNSFAQTTFTGKVTDKSNGENIIGASVYIADLRAGVVTDLNGVYTFENIPKRKFLVQVKLLGYTTISETVDLSKTDHMDFKLSTSVLETNEVVVTGSAFITDNNRNSLSVTPVDRKQLETSGAANISDALAQVPGVSGISTGGAISKPVIRGLGYNRIVTISDGLRQEGQQWGDEHGLEIDQFAADRIEILKGPSSLLYGSDAIGGVINILEPIPAPLNTIRGEFASQYGTNNALISNSLMAEGNQKGLIWRLRGTYKDASAYKTPTEYIYNSAFSEQDVNALIGINRKWGFSHFHISSFTMKPGLIEGERDSLTGQFVNSNGELVSNNAADTRNLDLPFQKIAHLKISSVNSFFIGKGNLKLVLGWQQNDRKEFADSRTVPGLFFSLETMSVDAKYYLPEQNGISAVVGLSSLHQKNTNKGDEFLIPAYQMQEQGAFFSVKKDFTKMSLNAGLRFDNRTINGDQLDTLFQSFKTNINAFSGSLGMAYIFNEKVSVKFNAGRGFRAPNISELAANGVHEGTFRYEIGNPDLHPETSLQFDLGTDVTYKKAVATISAFYNLIDNFIYYRNTNNETKEVSSVPYPVYRYVQGQSSLYGLEAGLDLHVIDPLHFENTIAYVVGTNEEANEPLPFIPPFHFTSSLNYSIERKINAHLRDSYLKFGVDVYSKQDRLDAFETTTNGAVVFNAGIGTSVKIGKQWASIFALCSNLTDVSYYNHLSRLKDAGIYSMGRNITFGLSLPFGLKN